MLAPAQSDSTPPAPARAGSIAIIVLALIGAGTLAQLYLAPDYVRAKFAHAVTAPPPSQEAAAAPAPARQAAAPAAPIRTRAWYDASRVRVKLGAWTLEPWAIALFLLVLVVQAAAEAWAPGEASGRFRFYLFCLAIAGVSGALWGLRQVDFDWRVVSWPHRTAILCIAGIFAITAWSPYASFGALARNAGRDAWTIVRRPPLWMAVAIGFAIIAVKAQAPATAAATPTGAAFEPWFASQPRLTVPVDTGGARVVLVKFNDYQCPPCNRTQQTYQPLLERLEQEEPTAFRFVSLDYPLETECNSYVTRDVHPAACEAAVAVRLAREHGKDKDLADWLWAHQRSLTREVVLRAAREVGGVEDIDARYQAVLADVRADVEKGKQLEVEGTPTFFLNGVRLPGVDVTELETALRYELRTTSRAAATGAATNGPVAHARN
jgi:protein-disulfide isomerase